jgi:hypothetical protein
MGQQLTPPPSDALDPDAHDPERASNTLRHLREVEKSQAAELARYRAALKTLGTDPATLTAPAAGAGLAPDLAAGLSTLLGVDASDPAAVLHAVAEAKMGATLVEVLHAASADPAVTRAVLAQEKALANIDAAAPDLREKLAAAVDDVMRRHPTLRVSSVPAVSGVPMPAGSGGGQAYITRDMLTHMDPAAVSDLARRGQLAHLGIGGKRAKL